MQRIRTHFPVPPAKAKQAMGSIIKRRGKVKARVSLTDRRTLGHFVFHAVPLRTVKATVIRRSPGVRAFLSFEVIK